MNIAFIGVGIMGRPMAAHLQAAGHQLRLVQHRSTLPDELIANGAMVCADGREAASGAQVVILMLPDTPDVEQALFAKGGVAEGLAPDTLVIDMSSIDPIATRSFAERITAAGCHYMDAPVSGGEVGAREATLSIMCGASEPVFERARPLLEMMGRNISLVGETGAGQVAKVANQIIVALNIEAVAEALLFTRKAGVDPERVRQALLGGFAASRVLEVHGQRMVKRSFAPGFRIELHQKDLDLALAAGKQWGISLPNTALTQQLFGACVGHGLGGQDHSAMVRALELLAGAQIGEDE